MRVGQHRVVLAVDVDELDVAREVLPGRQPLGLVLRARAHARQRHRAEDGHARAAHRAGGREGAPEPRERVRDAHPAAQVARAQDGEPSGEIVWALESAPPNLLPFGGISLAHWLARELMYDSLVAWDENLQVYGTVAESWETPDETSYVFKIRQGIKFHDGGDLTAKDVKY